MSVIKTVPVPHVVTVATLVRQLLGPNPSRVALTLSPGAANRFSLSFRPNVALDVGLTLYPLNEPVFLSCEQLGTGIQLPLFGISAVADQVIEITEWVTSP